MQTFMYTKLTSDFNDVVEQCLFGAFKQADFIYGTLENRVPGLNRHKADTLVAALSCLDDTSKWPCAAGRDIVADEHDIVDGKISGRFQPFLSVLDCCDVFY